MNNLLTEIDYKRLEQIERIRNQYFKEMPTGHEFNKLNKNLLKEAYKKIRIRNHSTHRSINPNRIYYKTTIFHNSAPLLLILLRLQLQ